MPVKTPTQLKNKFLPGATPSSLDFADMIDSMRNAGEMIPAADINGLQDMINAPFNLQSDSIATYADLPTGLTPADANKAYRVIADGKIYVWDGTAFPADGDGVEFTGVMPIDGEVKVGDDRGVTGGAVHERLMDVFQDLPVDILHQDVSPSAVSYGASIDAYGWAFAMQARKNISKVRIKLTPKAPITAQRLVIREESASGAILYDNMFSHELNATEVVEFDLSTTVANGNNAKLFCEIYADAPLYVYRVHPAVVFTDVAGYSPVRYTLANDYGASGTVINDYADLYHEVITESDKLGFNSDAEAAIATIANDNLLMPANVVAASDVTNMLYALEDVEVGEFVIFEDGTGPTYNNLYGLGFPVGELTKFDRFEVDSYYVSGSSNAPTQAYIHIRSVNKDGDILATSELLSFAPPTVTGRYRRSFVFNAPVDFDGRLYCEIRMNGVFGLYRRYPNPTTIFTEANGYGVFGRAITEGGALSDSGGGRLDWWFKTNELEKKAKLTEAGEELLHGENGNAMLLPNENKRYSFTGSSVTWGDGYLQSRYVGETIRMLQSEWASSIVPEDLATGSILANRKYYLGSALLLEGVGEEISFQITGNEVSIVQAIRRSNDCATEIEVYIDDVLYDTFNNYNHEPIGADSKSFVGDGTSVMFDLGRAFTYAHSVSIDGMPQVVTHNIDQGTGFAIPTASDCAVIRKLGQDQAGNVAVTHWLWFKTPPGSGADIQVGYDYGAALYYEKTTIGADLNGDNESPYGDGDTSFDPLAPASIATGLDFRETDERVVKTYRFEESKTRKVRLKVKGNFGAAVGTPYFIFNFATNRFFHFQNAGIGGWDLWDLDNTISTEALRGWQRVIAFNPSHLVIETTPNDDWIVRGHKLSRTENMTLPSLRSLKALPLRSISYQSADDSYDVSRWRGLITAITSTSVSFSGDVDTPIVDGDMLMIGQYYGNNLDYAERIVSGVVGNTIYFDKPLDARDLIYEDLQDLVGKELGVRSFGSFSTKLEAIIGKIRANTNCEIHLLENPMPNVLARELWGYPLVMQQVSLREPKVHTVDYASLRRWQMSQPAVFVSLDVASATIDPYLGLNVIEFANAGDNILAVDVLIDGLSVYGTRAVVEPGWAYTVDQSDTGADLNKDAVDPVNAGLVINAKKPRVIITDAGLTTGTLEVRYASRTWSGDSCHLNSVGSKVYASFISRHLIR